jgi:hypothetical protein
LDSDTYIDILFAVNCLLLNGCFWFSLILLQTTCLTIKLRRNCESVLFNRRMKRLEQLSGILAKSSAQILTIPAKVNWAFRKHNSRSRGNYEALKDNKEINESSSLLSNENGSCRPSFEPSYRASQSEMDMSHNDRLSHKPLSSLSS